MNFMDKIPTGYLFLTNCFIEKGSETVIKHGPHPRLTYFKMAKADFTGKDIIELKHQVYNKNKDFPTTSYDIVYLKKGNEKKKEEKKLRILDVQEQGLIPQGRILPEVQGREIMLCFIHQHNRTMFMSYLIHGEQSGANKFELHHMYRDENGKIHQNSFFQKLTNFSPQNQIT